MQDRTHFLAWINKHAYTLDEMCTRDYQIRESLNRIHVVD